ncbi:hypothetical protein HW555_009308 [Spodoptera exigua]|uniref:Uncharacterized protein n=1 Tax=Spodoptera exigua TaxID=7107 RepID=A0A835G958_SPOEX|nr:hypothetical protein HW555_009308 [Spodoptera exigua]
MVSTGEAATVSSSLIQDVEETETGLERTPNASLPATLDSWS